MRTCSGAQPDDRQPRLTSAKRSAPGLGWRVADHAAVRAGGTARLRPERNPALPAKGPVRHHEEPALIGRGREALAFGLKGQDRSDHSSVDENRSLITTCIRSDKLHTGAGCIKAG
jgi:hypothetical protein